MSTLQLIHFQHINKTICKQSARFSGDIPAKVVPLSACNVCDGTPLIPTGEDLRADIQQLSFGTISDIQLSSSQALIHASRSVYRNRYAAVANASRIKCGGQGNGLSVT